MGVARLRSLKRAKDHYGLVHLCDPDASMHRKSSTYTLCERHDHAPVISVRSFTEKQITCVACVAQAVEDGLWKNT